MQQPDFYIKLDKILTYLYYRKWLRSFYFWAYFILFIPPFLFLIGKHTTVTIDLHSPDETHELIEEVQKLPESDFKPIDVPEPVKEVKTAPSGSCKDWMQQAGVTDMANAYELIMRESGCAANAVNPTSGACGIGQQLPCGKWPHAWNDPVGGIIDMQVYVFNRYGSWAGAVAFHDTMGWY